MEIDRVLASDPAIITLWFKAVEAQLREAGVEDKNTWNGDEIGSRHNHHQSETAVFDKLQGVPLSVTSSKTKWTTVMECVSATGRAIRPLVLHQGKRPLQPLDSWFPPTLDCPDWWYGFTEKGRISKLTFPPPVYS